MRKSDRFRQTVRAALAVSVMMAAVPYWGCQQFGAPAQTHEVARTREQLAAPVVGSEPPSDRIFIPLQNRQPLQGEALAKARMTRTDIERETRSKTLTTVAATAPATRADDSNAPPQALKYYLQGRERFQEGASAEAIELLDKALRIDPQAFDVLKLMGQVCFANNQVARSSLYLQRAWNLRPDDLEVNALLGQYWAQRREWPTAIQFFLNAEKSPDRTVNSPLTPLTEFYLAHAFQQAGYHHEAAVSFEAVLSMLAEPVASYRYDHDLVFLMHEDWALHLAAAENFYVTQDWSNALRHYLQAANDRPADTYIHSRIVACHILLKDKQTGLIRALELVEKAQGSEQSLALLNWAYRTAGRESRLVKDLEKFVASHTAGAGPVMALANVQERNGKSDDAIKTLRNYLAANSNQSAVLRPLLRLARQQHREEIGFDVLVGWLSAHPDQAAEVREMLWSLVEGTTEAAVSQKLIDTATGDQENGYRAYLAGVLAKRQNQEKVSVDQWSRATKLLPQFWPAREAYIAELISEARYAEAQEQLQAVINAGQGGVKPYLLMIELDLDQENVVAALDVATRAKKQFATSPDVRMALGNIYRLRGQFPEAMEEFRSVANETSANELAYRALIETALISNDAEVAIASLRNLLSANPSSPYGQAVAAQIAMQTGRAAEAENIARRMYMQRPQDPEVAVLLARMQKGANHADAAIKTLESFLAGQTPTTSVVQALTELYRDAGRNTDALALAEKYFKAQPDSALWRGVYADELIAAKRNKDAEDLLRDGLNRAPQSALLEAELTALLTDQDRWTDAIAVKKAFLQATRPTPKQLYDLSHLYQQAGDMDNTLAVLRQTLTIAPYHAGANNDLGYFLAERNEKIDEARKLVERAVEAMPNNAAFVDSLGWVAYKEGKFEEAVSHLSRAVNLPRGRDPQLLAHLGDALIRTKDNDQARQYYQEALEMLGAIPADKQQKEYRDLSGYLEKVLKQMNAGGKVTVSPTIAEEKSK